MNELDEKAKELRNQYAREWRKNNKDKVKQANHTYWLKQAQKNLEKKGE